MKKYVDLLSVRPMNGGNLDLVLAKSGKAHTGDLVVYGDGKIGKVERTAWIGELDGEAANLLLDATDVSPATAVYNEYWRHEDDE